MPVYVTYVSTTHPLEVPMAVRPTRKPLIIGREHLRGRIEPGNIIATVYRGADGKRWVRSETVQRIIRHRDGTTTLITAYTKRPRLTPDTAAPHTPPPIPPHPPPPSHTDTPRPLT